MHSNKYHDWLVSPLFIFIFMWGTQIIGYLAFSDIFYSFTNQTWYVLITGVIAFSVGCTFAQFIGKKRTVRRAVPTSAAASTIRKILIICIPMYIIFILIPSIYKFIFAEGSAEIARNLFIEATEKKDLDILILSNINQEFVLLAVFSVCHANVLSKKMLVSVVLVGIAAALQGFGRTPLLMLFSASSVSLYLQNKISFRSILILIAIFIFAFFALAAALGKGGGDLDISESITWNLQVYLFNGLACFNSFLVNHYPTFPNSILMPHIISRIASLFSTQTEAITGFPFVTTPLPGNVYTAFYPWYHDGGSIGVIIGFGSIGYLSQHLYLNRHNSITSLYFYSIFTFPLFMTVFAEQYLTIYAFWIAAAAIPLVLFIGIKFLKLMSRSRQFAQAS